MRVFCLYSTRGFAYTLPRRWHMKHCRPDIDDWIFADEEYYVSDR